jgi:hypothetical protein
LAETVQSQNSTKRKIAPETLRQLFTFDPDEGIFRYQKDKVRCKAGSVAGSIHRQGWRSIKINKRCYPAHHLAWLWVHGRWPIHEIDHINGVRDDNRFINLREADAFQQVMNSARPRTNTSGVKNVYFDREMNRYRVHLRHKKKSIHIGYFPTLQEAASAAADARNRLQGDFATSR